MQLVIGDNERVAAFVASQIWFCRDRGFGACTAIGIENDNGLIGGFVFHDWVPEFGVIEISFAGTDKRWLTRPLIWAAFDYVFNQLRCQMACSRTPANLKPSLRMLKAYGFNQVRVPRLFGRDEDGIVSTLTVEDWRANGWHKENRDGQIIASQAA